MKIKRALLYACVPIAVVNITVSLVIYSGNYTGINELRRGIQKTFFTADATVTAKDSGVSCWNYTSRETSVTRGIDCFKLFQDDEVEIMKAKSKLYGMNKLAFRAPDPLFLEFTENCDNFKRIRGYVIHGSNSTDADYPIAFNILMYQDVDQFERLLRAVYQPQHQYCIHVDKKSSSVVKDAVLAITRCFTNVFVSKESETIVYAGVSRVMADINCMRQHLERRTPWKYLLNYASTELPIRTNEELTSILKTFNGTNDIHMTTKYLANDRFGYKHVVWYNKTSKRHVLIKTSMKKSPPPYNIKITKGNAYNIFSREFVEFVLQNNKAKQFLNWSRDTYSPDEHFWSSLNNLKDNPHLHTPGGFRGFPDDKPYTAKYIQWRSNGVCGGKYVRSVCVLGVRDLHRLWGSPHIAANKFHLNYDPIAYSCLEKILRNKTIVRTPLKYKYYGRVHSRADGSRSP